MGATNSSILAILIVFVPLVIAAIAARRSSTIVRRNGHNDWCRCPSCMAATRR